METRLRPTRYRQQRAGQLAVKWPEKRARRWRVGHAPPRSAWGTRRSPGTVRTPGTERDPVNRCYLITEENRRARPGGVDRVSDEIPSLGVDQACVDLR